MMRNQISEAHPILALNEYTTPCVNENQICNNGRFHYTLLYKTQSTIPASVESCDHVKTGRERQTT